MPQPRQQPPPQPTPAQQYAGQIAGVLGAQAAGEPPEPPSETARHALELAILAWLARYAKRARELRLALIRERVSTVTRNQADLENILQIESDFEAEYARKQKERIRAELAVISAIPDPSRRASAVRSLMRNERRIDRQRNEMSASRAYNAVRRIELRVASPQGAFWRLSERVVHCPVCLFMAGRFWPWEVLDLVNPPVHPNCGCDLHGYGEALANGWVRPGDVLSPREALQLARGVVLSVEEAADVLHEVLQRELPPDLARLLEAKFASFKWDPWAHPRDNLGKFVKTIADLAPVGYPGAANTVQLDSKTRVARDKDGTYRVTRSGAITKGFTSPADAALHAVNASVKSKDPDSVGMDGPTENAPTLGSFKDFDTFLKAKGIDPTDPWLASGKGGGLEGHATLPELEAERDRIALDIVEAKHSGDKYRERAIPTLTKRLVNIKAKHKKLAEATPITDPGEAAALAKKGKQADGGGPLTVVQLESLKLGQGFSFPAKNPTYPDVEVTMMAGGKYRVQGGPLSSHATYGSEQAHQVLGFFNTWANVTGNEGGVGDKHPSEQPEVQIAIKKNPAAYGEVVSGLEQMGAGEIRKWPVESGAQYSVYKTGAQTYSVKTIGTGFEPVVIDGWGAKERAAAMLANLGATGTGAPHSPQSGPPPSSLGGAAAPHAPPKPDDAWDKLPKEAALSSAFSDLQATNTEKLAASERSAIGSYTGSGYDAINSQLRASGGIGSANTEEKIARMDEAFRKLEGVHEDVLIWRGISSYKGSVTEKYKQAEVGSVIRDNGFVSSTTRKHRAESWGSGGVVLKIRWPKGAKGLWVSSEGDPLSSQGSGEEELILPRGVSFKVLRREAGFAGGVLLVVEPVTGHK